MRAAATAGVAAPRSRSKEVGRVREEEEEVVEVEGRATFQRGSLVGNFRVRGWHGGSERESQRYMRVYVHNTSSSCKEAS